jgi:hypothetical protein
MTSEKFFAQAKQNCLGDNRTITSSDDADALHGKLSELCSELVIKIGLNLMPQWKYTEV